jgi:regulator of sirC expression with transglutaminase-like and TPR domain
MGIRSHAVSVMAMLCHTHLGDPYCRRHFMLSPAAEDVEVLVDPFNGGEVCFIEDAADRLANIHGIKVCTEDTCSVCGKPYQSNNKMSS